MYLASALATILTCIATVKAQTPGFNPIIKPTQGQEIRAGQKFDIVWNHSGAPDDATVSIKLLQGDSPTTLQEGPNVGTKIPSRAGKFTWSVPPSVRDHKTYGLVMYLDGRPDIFQYSFPFDIEGKDNDRNDPPAPTATRNPNPDPKKVPYFPDPSKGIDHDKDDKHDKDEKDDEDDDEKDDKDKKDDKDGDDDKHHDHDDHDHDHDHDHDDDDDDDDEIYLKPFPPVVIPIPSGAPGVPKYFNDTYYKPPVTGPPTVKPSDPAGPPVDKSKPISEVNGASSITFSSFALVSAIVVAITC